MSFTKIIVILNALFIIELVQSSELIIKMVKMRAVRGDDIGLFFDMAISNLGKNDKETLDFAVHSNQCCLKIPGKHDCTLTRIVGGEFGQIHPGESSIVTLILPTITLLNREGYCDLILVTTKVTGDKIKIFHRLHFNTTYDRHYLHPVLENLKDHYNLTECQTPDQNPLNNCEPENCDEKYFGQRNFFNSRINLCEEVPDCDLYCSNNGKEIKTMVFYDYANNECKDLTFSINDADLEFMLNGKNDELLDLTKINYRKYPKFKMRTMESENNNPGLIKANFKYKLSKTTIITGTILLSLGLIAYFALSFIISILVHYSLRP